MNIQPIEVPLMMRMAFPEYHAELSGPSKPRDLHQAMNQLQQITCRKLEARKYQEVKKCFHLAERLHKNGNRMVRQAIEYIYVHAIGNCLAFAGHNRALLMSLMPLSLLAMYMRMGMDAGY